MISADYCETMAHYNAWQNNQMKAALDALGEEALRRDRGAFFGSVLGTVNHLLWGDMIWYARFTGTTPPTGSIPESVDLCPTFAAWGADRFRMDAKLILWAEKLRNIDLRGDLSWYSAVAGHEVHKPLVTCITHMFNHQTHHRGQVHAMVTAAGGVGWTSDLAFMPDMARA